MHEFEIAPSPGQDDGQETAVANRKEFLVQGFNAVGFSNHTLKVVEHNFRCR